MGCNFDAWSPVEFPARMITPPDRGRQGLHGLLAEIKKSSHLCWFWMSWHTLDVYKINPQKCVFSDWFWGGWGVSFYGVGGWIQTLNWVGECSTNDLHLQALCPERKDWLCESASLALQTQAWPGWGETWYPWGTTQVKAFQACTQRYNDLPATKAGFTQGSFNPWV